MPRQSHGEMGGWDAAPSPTRRPSSEAAGDGRSGLDAASRARWESVLGRDLSSVRVQTDEDADRIASAHGANAFTLGSTIGFRHGVYRPGTIEGEAVLAHELAHVAQQEIAGPNGDHSLTSAAIEHDADGWAMVAMERMLFGGPRPQTSLPTGAGLRFQSCGSERETPIPAYLGAESREALRDIERITSSGKVLGYLIVLGTAVNLATSTPAETLATQGHDVTPQAQALTGIPVIVHARVLTVIELLLVSHENDMNEEERAFWHRMHDRVAALQGQAANRGGTTSDRPR